MKKFFPFLLALFALTAASGQVTGLRIMDMPVFLGNPSGAYVPIVVNGANRKYDAGKLGFNKVDSLAPNGSNIDVYKNGVKAYTMAVPSGETSATIRTKLGAASASNAGYISTADYTSFSGKQAALGFTPENSSNRGAALGYAPLDAASKIPVSYLPTSGFTYVGTWNAATNTPALSDATGTNGQVYTVNFAGTQNLGSGSLSLAVGDQLIHNATVWQKVTSSSAVQSVANKTGVIVLTAADVDTTTSRTWLSPAEKAAFAAKQPALGYTPLSSAAGAVGNASLASGIDAAKLTGGLLPKGRIGPYTGDVIKNAGDTVLTIVPGLDPLKLGRQNVSAAELANLDSTTGPIQKQIDSKAGLSSPAFTGTPTAPTAAVTATSTQVANTAFVAAALAAQPALTIKQAAAGYRLGKFLDSITYRMRTLVITGATVDTSTTDSLMKITFTGGSGGGYSLQGSLTSSSPAASSAFFIGSISGVMTGSPGVNRIFIPHDGTISKVIVYYSLISGNQATNTEASTFSLGYVAKGAATTTETFTTFATQLWGNTRDASVESASTFTKAVKAGDWIEVKVSTPTIAAGTSLATGVRFSLQIWVD